MASFAGIAFQVDMGNYSERRTARVAVQEIPGGDNFYVDRGGRGAMYVDMTVLLQNTSVLGALMANLGQISVLDVDGRDSHMATLMEVSGEAQMLNQQLKATLKFVVVD